jgi:hypothetical protein
MPRCRICHVEQCLIPHAACWTMLSDTACLTTAFDMSDAACLMRYVDPCYLMPHSTCWTMFFDTVCLTIVCGMLNLIAWCRVQHICNLLAAHCSKDFRMKEAGNVVVPWLIINFETNYKNKFVKYVGAGVAQSVYNVWLQTGRPGDPGSIPGRGKRIFYSNLCVQTGSGAHPASCTMGNGSSLPGVKRSRGVMLTTYPLLVPPASP